jgi:xanthine dehydrogenase/oxidase
LENDFHGISFFIFINILIEFFCILINYFLLHKRYAKYKVGHDKAGNIFGIIINWYCDGGNSPNDSSIMAGPTFVDNTYNIKNWHIISKVCKTNLPANTSVRSPGSFPAIAIIESIVEHVAASINKDPLQVRLMNFYQKGDLTPTGQPLTYFNVDTLTSQLITSSNYRDRINEIKEFNKANRWKKRGISLTPVKWNVGWQGAGFNCFLSIYANDGSVSVSHGGIEMGQGIHTKVGQVCAYELNIPIELISIKHTDNFTNPNGSLSGGSITSELACQVKYINLIFIRR